MRNWLVEKLASYISMERHGVNIYQVEDYQDRSSCIKEAEKMYRYLSNECGVIRVEYDTTDCMDTFNVNHRVRRIGECKLDDISG